MSITSAVRKWVTCVMIPVWVLTSLPVAPHVAFALPDGESVVSGDASFARPDDQTLQITTSDKVIINYDSFDIDAGQTVQFFQPSTSSVALNRIITADPSEIFGSLIANGQIILLNPNGIFFGPSSQVNSGSFIASTLNLSNEDFLSNNLFFMPNGNSTSTLHNQGTISVSDGGLAALIAPRVVNDGVIAAHAGTVAIAAADEVVLDFSGDGLIGFALNGAARDAVVHNTGTITAEGGDVLIAANSVYDVVGTVIKNEGVISARSVVNDNGTIRLVSIGEGAIVNAGTIDASASQAGATGGTVQLAADTIEHRGMITVSGDVGGGTVFIHGEQVVTVGSESTIRANAETTGNGGAVTVLSDDTLTFAAGGGIESTGGAYSGNGGTVEVSALNDILFGGQVDTTAANGEAGWLIIDPMFLEITNSDDANATFGKIAVATLVANLNTSNVKLDADQVLTVSADIDATGNANTYDLELEAGAGNGQIYFTNASIALKGSLEVDGKARIASGSGGLSISSQSGDIQFNSTIDSANYYEYISSTNRWSNASTDAATRSYDGKGGYLATITSADENVLVGSRVSGNTSFWIGGTDAAAEGTFLWETSANSPESGQAVTYTNWQGGEPNNTGDEDYIEMYGYGHANQGTWNDEKFNATRSYVVEYALSPTPLTLTANNGTVTFGGAVGSAKAVGNLTVNAASVDQNGAITSNGAVAITTSNALTIDENITSGGTTAITVTADDVGSPTFTLTAGDTITSTSGTVTITADDMDVSGNVNATGQRVILKSNTAGDAIDLGTNSATADTLEVSDAEIDRFTASVLEIGTASAGAITITSDISPANVATLNLKTGSTLTGTDGGIVVSGLAITTGGTVNMTDATTDVDTLAASVIGNFTFTDADALVIGTVDGVAGVTVSGDAAITTSGSLTDTAIVDINGATSLTAGAGNDITLDNATNDFTGAVSVVSGNNVTLVDTNAIDLGASTISGDLVVTSNGTITDSGAVAVTGTTSLTAGAGNDITLDVATNNFTGAVSVVSGNNVTLRDADAIILDNANISGNLAIVTSGTITDIGTVDVNGAMSLTAGAGNDITLDTVTNDFTGAVTVVSGNNVTFTDANAIDLAALIVSGNLAITANGAITDSGALTVTGTTSLTAGAGNDITLDHAANDFTGAVTVVSGDNVSVRDMNAISFNTTTVSGDLTVVANGSITDIGTVTVGGVTSLTAGNGNAITLNTASNNFTGAVSVVSASSLTLVDVDAIVLGNIALADNLSVTASGTITDTGTVDVNGTAAFAAGAGNDITLDTAANDFTGAVSVSSANTVTLRDTNAIVLGNLAASNNLTVIASGTITDTGTIDVNGVTSMIAGAGNDITLDTATNDFTGAVSVVSANNVSLRDANALVLGDIAASNNVTVTASGTITDTGTIDVNGVTSLTAGAGNDITLDTAMNDFTGAVSVVSGNNVTLVDANAIDFGASTISGNLVVTSNGTITDSGAVAVTGTTSVTAGAGNDITLDVATNNFTGAVSVASGNNVTLRDADAIILDNANISGNLAIVTSGTITDIGTVDVNGATSLTAGAGNDITLDTVANDFTGAVTVVSGNNVTFADANAIDLAALIVSGNLAITANGAITDSGALTVTGTTSLTAGAGNDITLDHAANNFTGAVSVSSGNNVTLRDANAIDLGASAVSGNLAVISSGAITDSGAVAVTGTTSLTAGAANDITLDVATNNFMGAVSVVSGNNVTLRDANAIDLGASTVSGNLAVTANGAITDSGAIAVTGTTTLTAGAANDITLDTATNNFTGAVSVVSGNNVTFVDANAIDLAALIVSGNVSISASGAITDSGALSVTGTTSLTAGAGNDITLDVATNNFIGAVSVVSGNNVTLRDANAIVLDNANISGNLAVVTSGTITDIGTVDVTGAMSLTVGAGNDITLDTVTNDFTGAVSVVSGNNVTLVDANAIDLGASTVSGNLVVTSNGTITDSGALAVTGTTSVTAGAGNDITLDHASNNFTGAVSVVSGNNVTLRDANAIDLGASTVSGNLAVTTSGAITDSGALTITGTTTLAAGAGNAVTLNSAANDFTGAVTVSSGGDVTLVDDNILIVGTSAMSGALSASATTRIDIVGDITSGTTQNYLSATRINANTNLSGTTVTFNSTLDSESGETNSLAITGNGVLNGIVGGSDTLSSVSVSGTSTIDTSAITTTGTQMYSGTTRLNQNATLTASIVTFGSTLNSQTGETNALAVTGNGVFNGIVGGSDNLSSLSVSGTSAINTTAITTTGTQGYTGGVTISDDLSLISTGGNITFGSTVAGTSLDDLTLTATAGSITLGGAVGSGDQIGDVDIDAATFNQNAALTAQGTVAITTSTAMTIDENITSGGTTAITVTADDTGSPTFTLTAGDTITSTSGTVTITADDVDVSGDINATGQRVIVKSNTAGDAINLGINSGTVNTLELSDAEIDRFTASVLEIGTTSAGAVTVSSDISPANVTTLHIKSGSTLIGTDGGIVVSGLAITTGGTVTITDATTDVDTLAGSITGNFTFTDADALAIGTVDSVAGLTVSGNAAITTNGALTDTAIVDVNGTTTLAAGAGNDITLDTATNDFTGAVSVTSGNTVTLRDANAIDLGASTVSGNLVVTTSGAVTDSGALAVTGTTSVTAGSGNNITLDTATNDFTGAVSIVSGNAVTLRDANAIDLGASTISGALAVTANGAITDSGAVAVTSTTSLTAGVANDITLDTATNNFTGAVSVVSANNVTLRDTNAIVLGNVAASNNLAVTANGTITDTGTVDVNGTTVLTAGAANSITLDTATNDFMGAVSVVSGNNVTLRDANAIVLGDIAASNNLTVTASGTITDTGTVDVNGATSLTAGVGNDITLDTATNDFTGAVSVVSGNNVTVRDTNAIVLGNLAASNNLTVTANGAITDTGTVDVNGATSLTAGAANSITLDTATNDFTGAVAVVSANNVTLRDVNAIVLGDIAASNNLTITASGTITDTGTVDVNGATSLTAGAGNDITLDTATNDFTGTVSTVSGNNVTLADANAIVFGASTISGALAVTANGTITDSGAVSVTGTTSLTAGVGNDITLDMATNNFIGAVSVVSGNNVTLRDANAIVFDNANISGNLAVVTSGTITDIGIVDVNGATSLTAGVGNDITLDTVTNDFTGAVTVVSGNNVTLVDANAIDLAALIVSGNLAITANGTITDSGAVAVTGTTSLIAGAGNDITLDHASNNFTGVVSVVSGNNVTLRDANAIDLGVSTVSGNLAVTSSGAITDSGALAVTGTTALAAGSGNAITLNSAANDFTGTVTVSSGGDVTLVDDNILIVGTSTTSGSVSASATTRIDIVGDITSGTTQSYLSAARLNGNTNLSGTTVTFNSTLNSESGETNALAITGNGVFNGAVGGSDNLLSLSVSGTTGLNAAITTTGTQNYTGAVTLGATSTLTSGGDITFGSMVNGGYDLSINAGANDVMFTGSVGNTARVGTLTISSANDMTAGAITAAGVRQVSGAGTTTVNGALNTNTAAGIDLDGSAFAINGMVTTTNAGIFRVTNSGTLTIGSAADMSLDGAFTQDGAGAVNLAGDITTTADDIIFAAPVALTGAVALATGTSSGAITFTDTLDGAYDLTLSSGGATTFMDAVGSTTALGDGTGTALTINSTGTTTFASTLATASGIFQADTAGMVTFEDDVTVGAGTAANAFNANVTFDGMTFTSNVASVFGNSAADRVTLSDTAVTIRTTGAGDTVTFNAAVNGGEDLTLDAVDAMLFNAAVGATAAVGDGTGSAIMINSTGTTTFASTLATASGVTQANGAGSVTFGNDVTIAAGDTATTFNGNVVLDGLAFSSDGAVTFGNIGTDTVTVSGTDVSITTTGAGDTITFVSTLNGGQDVMITTPATLVINTAVGVTTPVSSFTASAGTIDINAALTASGALSLTGPVYLGADMTTAGGDITITGSVMRDTVNLVTVDTGLGAGDITVIGTINADGAGRNLELLAGMGTVDLQSAIGSTTALAGLGVQSYGAVALTNAANDVDTIAAEITGSGNSFSFTDADTIAVGTVGTLSGITTNGGVITIRAGVDMNITQSILSNGGDIHMVDSGGTIMYTADVDSTSAGTDGDIYIETVSAGETIDVGFVGGSGDVVILTDITFDSHIKSGDGLIVVGGATAGDVTIGDADFGSKNIGILTGGDINDRSDPETHLITGGRIRLISTSGSIGNSNPVYINADEVIASAIGDVSIVETNAVTLTDIDSAVGDISLTSAGGTIIASDVTASAGSVTIAATAGDILIDSLSATGTITLTASNGAINENGSADSAVDITAGTLRISARDGIGTSGEGDIETAVSILEATATTGDVYLANTGAVTIGGGGLTVSDGTLYLTNSDTITVGGAITASNGMTIWSGGSILDDSDGADDLISNGAAFLTTPSGVIGSASDPLEVAIGGLLTVEIGGSLDMFSGVFKGTTADNTVHFSTLHPGQILFNNGIVGGGNTISFDYMMSSPDMDLFIAPFATNLYIVDAEWVLAAAQPVETYITDDEYRRSVQIADLEYLRQYELAISQLTNNMLIRVPNENDDDIDVTALLYLFLDRFDPFHSGT